MGLADLGCSEGKNSLMLMCLLPQLVRRRSHQPLMLTFNDLPANNWNGFFRNLTPYGPGIWAQANATSFFQPVVPPGTLHIACCYSAAHWLSQVPAVPNSDEVLFALMEPESRARLAAQAAQDWEAFLMARAQELGPGGRLVLVSGGNKGVAGLKMYCLLVQILKELGHPPFVMPVKPKFESLWSAAVFSWNTFASST